MKKFLTYDVIILGAGVAGLACADEILKNSNRRVLVIEKEKHVGGLAATFKYKKFSYDLAPHRWFTKNTELNTWIDELLGKELIWVKKHTPMYQFDKFFEYPFRIRDIMKKMPLPMTAIMLTSYLAEKIKLKVKPRKIVTMKDAYVSRFGYMLYKWFNQEFNEKLWGNDGCETMSADFVEQRVKNLSLVTAILDTFGINKHKVISLIPIFRFPKLGIGRISVKLAERIVNNRGTICLGEKIISIKKIKIGYQIETNKRVFSCRNLISSIPLNIFLELFNNKVHRAIRSEINKIKFVHQKIVVLFVNKSKLTNFTWVYVHPKKIKFFRFLETNNWSKAMSPNGKTSLVFEYPFQDGDEISTLNDDILIQTTITDFFNHFVDIKINYDDIIDSRVHLILNAYPKYDLNYAEALTKIKQYVKNSYSDLQLIGRSGMFHYNNLDHSIYTGILAARNYLNNKLIYNLDNVNNEAEYLEEIKQ